MKVYKMPNGKRYRFAEGKAPACAVPIEAEKLEQKEPEEKAKAPQNKARKPANKAKKAVTK